MPAERIRAQHDGGNVSAVASAEASTAEADSKSAALELLGTSAEQMQGMQLGQQMVVQTTEEDQRREAAAIKLQKRWRGRLGRKWWRLVQEVTGWSRMVLQAYNGKSPNAPIPPLESFAATFEMLHGATSVPAAEHSTITSWVRAIM